MTILLDFEGIIFNGNEFIKESFNFIKENIKKGYKIKIFSNTTRLSKKEILLMLQSQNINEINIEDIINGSTFLFKKLEKENIKNCLIFGNKSFINEIKEFGFNVKTFEDHNFTKIEETILFNDIEVIIIGSDFNYNYYRASLATRYILEKKVKFYCIGKDKFFPWNNNEFIPGPFSLSSAPTIASYISPEIIGKPSIENIDLILPNLNLSNTLIIGDNIDTDIQFAMNLNIKSILINENEVKNNSNICQNLLSINLESF